jgi:hypothetical protein
MKIFLSHFESQLDAMLLVTNVKKYDEVAPPHALESAESTVISARYSVDDLETLNVRRSVNFGAELRSGKRTSLFVFSHARPLPWV